MAINNLIIRNRRIIEADFSAYQWGLFVNSYPRREIEDIATRLNTHLNDICDTLYDVPYTKKEVRDSMLKMMGNFAVYGASDTEPRAFLDKVLDQIFGPDY